jgi:hypothetical protein
MQIQFIDWGIVEMNYSLLKNKERREKNAFGLRFKKVFSNRRKNNNLNVRVKKKNCFQNMIK